MTTKISRVVGTSDAPVKHPFVYDDTYVCERLTDSSERLKIGLKHRHVTVLRTLAALLSPPYKVLYVLHTTRTGALLGRYESDTLDGPEMGEIFDRFGAFFSGDARHDIWVRSAEGMLVLDRYNMLYAYGPLQSYERVLRAADLRQEAVPEVPRPHALHYHSEWDNAEQEALRIFGWRITALRPNDEQFGETDRN